jgi:hypothetical protein
MLTLAQIQERHEDYERHFARFIENAAIHGYMIDNGFQLLDLDCAGICYSFAYEDGTEIRMSNDCNLFADWQDYVQFGLYFRDDASIEELADNRIDATQYPFDPAFHEEIRMNGVREAVERAFALFGTDRKASKRDSLHLLQD